MGKQRKIKLRHICALAVVLTAVTGWILSVVLERQAQNRLDQELAKLKTLQIPTTPEEMRRAVDANMNAAPQYRLAIEALRRHGRSAPAPPTSSTSTSVDQVLTPPYREWVEANAETLGILETAAAKPLCDFNRAWEKGANLLLPEFVEMKSFVKLAVAKSRYAADAHDYKNSFHWLEVARRVGVHAREPLLIGQLVAIACESITLAELQRQIYAHGSDANFRTCARQYMTQMGDLASLRDGLKGEAMFTHVTMAQLASGTMQMSDLVHLSDGGGAPSNEPGLSERLLVMGFKLPGVRQDAEAKVLGSYRRTVERIGTDPNDYKKVLEGSSKLDQTFMDQDRTLSGQMAGIFVPVFSQAGVAIAKMEVNRRLTLCGLELFEIKAKTGAFPTSLPASASWSIDPFSDSLFLYAAGSSTFKLYSVGPNKKDDGGHPRFGMSGTSKSTDDIEFFAPRP